MVSRVVERWDSRLTTLNLAGLSFLLLRFSSIKGVKKLTPGRSYRQAKVICTRQLLTTVATSAYSGHSWIIQLALAQTMKV